jgi:hypothetical protein
LQDDFMSEEDPNIEREQVLSAIDQAIPTEPAAESTEPLPAAEPLPEAEPLPDAEPLPPEESVPHPPSSRGMPAPSAWRRRRHEIAGLVTAFVAIVWIAVAIAMGAWGPGLVGVMFAGGAACIRVYAPPAAG